MTSRAPDSLPRRYPLVVYFAIAYLVTWTLLLPLGLAARGMLPLPIPREWHALGALGPIVAAFVVSRAAGGAAGVRAWLSGFRRWRLHPGWWVFALASPFALWAVSAVLARMVVGSWPDLGRLSLPEYANGRWLADVLFVGTLAYGLGEEPGWRGFALPRLQARHGPLLATLILTPLWALWHWPAFLYRASYQGGLPMIVGFLFGLLSGAIVLTFLWNGTRSLPAVILWHTLINIALQVAAVVSQPVVVTMNVLIAVGAIGIVAWWVWLGPRAMVSEAAGGDELAGVGSGKEEPVPS